MAEGPPRWLVVMAREPGLGRVKSRLARDVGWVRATLFYRRTTAHLLKRLGRDPRWRLVLAVTPDRALSSGFWPIEASLRRGQGGGGLGARMGRLMAQMPPGPVVIVGSDIPAIGGAHIARAFKALGSHEAVLGPAEDGGYWLVGLRRRPRLLDPFPGVRWSGPHALADTLANLKGRSVALVDRLGDVDSGADYRALPPRRARLVQ